MIKGLNSGNFADMNDRSIAMNGLRSRGVHNEEEMEIVYINTTSFIMHLTNSILLF